MNFEATKSTIDHGKPYTALPARDDSLGGYWYVADHTGFNVLSFSAKPGAKFTSVERAKEIADRWNQK